MSDNYLQQVLENGLFIEQIPLELRTLEICINAMHWGLQINVSNNHLQNRETCKRILRCIPEDLLLEGWCSYSEMTRINTFS